MNYVSFFSKLGFNFKVDLKYKAIDIERNMALTDKLEKNIFFYKSPNNTNTSFYLITTEIITTELEEIRKYIWNKNDADLIFYYPNENSKLEMFYAKYSPKISREESILDSFSTFSTSQKDLDKIENIKHWQFNSGVFWLNYQSFIDKAKYKGIDKELVSTLKALKDKLYNSLYNLTTEENKLDETVQALIDRTLYIKYLEDNHIINSHFYGHYFKDTTLNYGKLLENKSNADINKLFKKIHEIFNNALFDQPTIDDNYLTSDVRSLIAASFNTEKTGQLRLFDFQFNLLPVEFISYIYEVFLSDKQRENGIYYTPKKLAQLIVDDVIKEDIIGSILDPSCGSGMFLIVGFQRLLEIAERQKIEPENNIEKIRYRTKLLADNIFGIEKELTAQRFTLFSLSLQIFKNIPAEEIKLFIANELKQNKEIKIFKENNFYKNIIHHNTLDIENLAFKDRKFTYIVGNPPFVRKEVSEEAKNFTNNYQLEHLGNIHIAKDIIDGFQISQCFLLKIKEWSELETRFGFISNSSNFDYETEKFLKFFYSNYGIEKIYELSRVKDILFEKAKESVVAIVFNNNYQNNVIDYYTVDKGLFSEKPFELLIIQEDKAIQIEQEKLIEKQIRLRDFLVGNEIDRLLVSKIGMNSLLSDFASPVHRGFEIWGEDARKKEFKLSNDVWKTLSVLKKKDYLDTFIEKYFKANKSSDFDKPYIEPANLKPFIKTASNQFISSVENFHRPRIDRDIYLGNKLIFTRIGNKLNCVYSKDTDYFNFSVYTIKLKDEGLYYLFQAILNSYLIQFYLDFYLRKRVFDSFSRIGNEEILNIPIPKELDQELVTQISKISKDLTEGKYIYSEKEKELNELIFDLYELTYWEKQRIRDYFLPSEKIGRKKNKLNSYKTTLKEVISFYLKNSITIEETPADFNLIVVKVSLNNKSDSPKANKGKKFILNEIFEQNPNDNFLASQEKIYGNNCVYIIKEGVNKNWTETKSFEDGQDILKHLISNENGERIH